MTRPPQNSIENKHEPNQCEDHGDNGCGVRLPLLTLIAYGAFTIGAVADDGTTRLELDLVKVDGGTPRFRQNQTEIIQQRSCQRPAVSRQGTFEDVRLAACVLIPMVATIGTFIRFEALNWHIDTLIVAIWHQNGTI